MPPRPISLSISYRPAKPSRNRPSCSGIHAQEEDVRLGGGRGQSSRRQRCIKAAICATVSSALAAGSARAPRVRRPGTRTWYDCWKVSSVTPIVHYGVGTDADGPPAGPDSPGVRRNKQGTEPRDAHSAGRGIPRVQIPVTNSSNLYLLLRRQRTDQPVRLVVRSGAEVEVRRRCRPHAELQVPQPGDHQRRVVRVVQETTKGARCRSVGADQPIAEVADQDIATRAAKIRRRSNHRPRRIELPVRHEALHECAGRVEDVDKPVSYTGLVILVVGRFLLRERDEELPVDRVNSERAIACLLYTSP